MMLSRRKSQRSAISTFQAQESLSTERSVVQRLKRTVKSFRQHLYISSRDIEWLDLPQTIGVFEPLESYHLCAAASGGVNGSYIYDPPLGAHFSALGMRTLRCTFRPRNKRLGDVESEIDIEVVRALPHLEWPAPPWLYETQPLLSSRHLNARLQMHPQYQLTGHIDYDPPELTVLPVGTHEIRATFVTHQKHREFFEATSELVRSVEIRPREVPALEWAVPADVYSTTRLSSLQLNAKCNVEGTFEYDPPQGAAVTTGLLIATVTLHVQFVPADLQLYRELSCCVPLRVLPQEEAAISWVPGPVHYGDTLTQELADRCSSGVAAGSIALEPSVGYVFDRVGCTAVSAHFRSSGPRYRDSWCEFSIPVLRVLPLILWSGYTEPQYSSITPDMLNATVAQPISGSFLYSKAVGLQLDQVGEEIVTVTFLTASAHLGQYEERSCAEVVCRVQPQRHSGLHWECMGRDHILHTEPLGAAQLCATADCDGAFEYEPPSGALLPEGRHELRVRFQPVSRCYLPATASMYLTVSPQALPTLLWCPLDDSLVYGEPLTEKHCNARCPDAEGVFEYDPPLGDIVEAGRAVTIRATFRPTSKRFIDGVEVSTRLRVARVEPSIRWQPPLCVYEGTALSGLNALCAEIASVREGDCSGCFEYSPNEKTLLAEGSHVLSVTFLTAKVSLRNYTETARMTVKLVVRARGQPTIDWSAPSDIIYGTPISVEQLTAFRTDSLCCSGSIRFDPSKGRVLDACERRWLRATFIPDNEVEFKRAAAEVHFNIHKADPRVCWKNPPATYANQLLGPQHYAASVEQEELQEGVYTYNPPLGTLLETDGEMTLALTFTPPIKKRKNYNCVTLTRTLVVVPLLKPELQWPLLRPVDYGTPLSSEQLCPKCLNTPGAFRFSSANNEGAVLPVGLHTLKATFIPVDIETYSSSLTSATLEIRKAPPRLVWPQPPKLYIGKPLGPDRLNARVVDELGDMKNPEGGTFIYSPPAGEMLIEEGIVRLVCYFKPSVEDEPLYRITTAFADLQVVRRRRAVPHPPSPPKPVSKQARVLLTNPQGNSDFVDTTMSY